MGGGNIRRSIIGAVLAGASVVGVAGMASSAAHAETPTTEREVGATAQPTRRFWIENLTSETLLLAESWSGGEERAPLLPDDSVPGRFTVIRPGEHITVEVVAWADHEVTVTLLSASNNRTIDIKMYVFGFVRLATANTSSFKVDVNGGNIWIHDK